MIRVKSEKPVNVALSWFTSEDLAVSWVLDTASGDFPASQFNAGFWTVKKTPDSPVLFSSTTANNRLSLATVTIDGRQKTVVTITNGGLRDLGEGVYFHELVLQDVTNFRKAYINGQLTRSEGLL
jgi:hypothetical protein